MIPICYFTVRGVNSASDVVDYCRTKPMFREVNMKKYLSATTTRRIFSHVTAAQIESSHNLKTFKSRSVATLEGTSFDSN